MTDTTLPLPARETRGLVLGLIGVTIFGLTLPMTRLAVVDLSPVFITFGRSCIAGVLALIILLATRQKWPDRAALRHCVTASAGVIFGFPLLMSYAMQSVPAAHGAVVLGVLPLATAAFGAILAGERPSAAFWTVASLGSLTVVIFALWEGGMSFSLPDLALLGAVIAASHGYAEGARAAKFLGGWQTICWMLVLALPLLIPAFALVVADGLPTARPSAWWGFAYNALFSQFLGFFAWYRGLAIGGIARVGQVQLLQAFITIAAAALLFGEVVDLHTIIFAAAVVVLVAIGRRMPVR